MKLLIVLLSVMLVFYIQNNPAKVSNMKLIDYKRIHDKTYIIKR